jgi:L-amino acid N-acyltransferase YncA
MTDVSLRLATLDDAPAVAAIYAPYVRDTVISFEAVPPAPDEMRSRIADALARHAWLVACRGDDVVGYAYASMHRTRAAYRWSVDTGVYLDASAHRRGIGRRLYGALFALLARQRYASAYAGITLPNAASVGLHESTGFVLVGVYERVGYKLGAWRDVGWWGRRLCEGDDAPEEPRALSELDAGEVKAVVDAA